MSGLVRLDWYGDRFAAQLERDLNSRLDKVGREVVARIKDNISTLTAVAGPSAPGGYPHMDTGDLYNKIAFRRSSNELDIISASEHTMALENGTRFTAPRPFLWRSVNEMSGRILEIVLGG